MMKETASQLFPPNPDRTRNPGVEAVNYFLDLARIIDPTIATFDDGVETFMKSLREKKFFPFMLLGGMIDDTINRLSDQGYPDFLADTEGAKHFCDSVLKFTTPDEQAEVQFGLTVPAQVIKEEVMRLRRNEN